MLLIEVSDLDPSLTCCSFSSSLMCYIAQKLNTLPKVNRFLSAVCPRKGEGWGGGGGGGNYIFVCKVCGKLGGFVFGPFINAIWWNLGLFSYKHNLPFMHHYIIDLHVK